MLNMSIRVLPDSTDGMIVRILWKKYSSTEFILELCCGNDSCFNFDTSSSSPYYSIRTKVICNLYLFFKSLELIFCFVILEE